MPPSLRPIQPQLAFDRTGRLRRLVSERSQVILRRNVCQSNAVPLARIESRADVEAEEDVRLRRIGLPDRGFTDRSPSRILSE